MHFGVRGLAALLVVPTVILAACGAQSKSRSASTSPGSATDQNTTATGVEVTGNFGVTPTITVPATPAPQALTQQIITQGVGAVVAKGDTLIANYVGQTWAPKNGKVNVFDDSFAHGSAAAFPIGAGRILPGWDKTLVGKKLGTRVLLTVPPADGYGTNGQPSIGVTSTSTLVFVIDLVAAYKPDAAAPGTVVSHLRTNGLPEITNVPGRKPQIISTAGVRSPAKPISTLVVTGSGAKINAARTLVLQLVKVDLSGKNSSATWGRAPQVVVARSVLSVADKLTGQNVGSRVIVLLPPSPATPASGSQPAQAAAPAEVLIIDVVGQF